jgi:hypothetical protein
MCAEINRSACVASPPRGEQASTACLAPAGKSARDRARVSQLPVSRQMLPVTARSAVPHTASTEPGPFAFKSCPCHVPSACS